jgi:hypothetical protein
MLRFASRFGRALALAMALVTGIAPVLAYAHPAVAALGGDAEICTDAGLTRVPVDGGRTPLARLAHCALCLAPNGMFAPGSGAASFVALERVAWRAQAWPPALTPVEPVRAAHPRGPPARPARFA